MERVYITAIHIDKGIIQLIEPNGKIGYYAQRGIQKYSQAQLNVLVSRGKLRKDWKTYKELPKNWSISYEEPSIMGRAYATFNPDRNC